MRRRYLRDPFGDLMTVASLLAILAYFVGAGTGAWR
jgi:hypothetical protein